MINLQFTGLCHGLGTNQVDNQLSASTARRRSKKRTTFFSFFVFLSFTSFHSVVIVVVFFFPFFIMKVGVVDCTPSGFESWPGLYVVFLGTTTHAHKRSLHKSL